MITPTSVFAAPRPSLSPEPRQQLGAAAGGESMVPGSEAAYCTHVAAKLRAVLE